MKGYSLMLTGTLSADVRRSDAVAALAELLRLSLSQADAVLNGQPRALKGRLTGEQAEQARARFERAGIGCLVREEEGDAQPPRPAAEAFAHPPNLGVDAVALRCPKCGEAQPPGEICRRCGIVFAKFEHARRRTSGFGPQGASAARGDGFPYRLVNQLLWLLFLSSLALALWSHWKKEQFPDPDFYDLARLTEPRQTGTLTEPFQIRAGGVDYRIEPLFDYELDGVVVSLHDSDVFWDIYHFKDWKDFINIRDLCVVWGENVASGVFREMRYSNTTWTCWVSTASQSSASAFAWDQLSNNHLLSHAAPIQKAIKSAEIGDQIHLRGQLASYSHAGGFRRGSSTTRTDTGNGACETVHVEEFEITRKSNPGWRRLYRLAFWASLGAALGLVVVFLMAPYRQRG